ncbi:hypothetical protein [Mesorhizobium escarrei]|uniref:Uncharacterized protein n=1 Tax=Mesorhizobium escarrei TaxID=666018 RepID=A0ABN8JTK2_9HYPH|nr:hypothetical protein [Mesorhizobium escarrei]CAH2400864.1 hypothetical protein MES5069_270102 [Mesorhizobium escarrei]
MQTARVLTVAIICFGGTAMARAEQISADDRLAIMDTITDFAASGLFPHHRAR